MIFKHIRSGLKVADKEFDAVYPDFIKDLSEIYFTPVNVTKAAAKFLVQHADTKVMDIGSGAGKFCLVGAACTNGCFTGVEQRSALCMLSREIVQRYRLTNVQFIHANITEINFRAFDAFYLFNPFFENFMEAGMLRDDTLLKSKMYGHYSAYVIEELDKMPLGTRLATFYCMQREVPSSYRVHAEKFKGKLKLLIKVV